MNAPKAITDALRVLSDRLILAEAVGQSFDLAGGENPPPWVYVYQRLVDDLSVDLDALEVLLTCHQWGYGGCAPHGDKVVNNRPAGRGPLIRDLQTNSRPD